MKDPINNGLGKESGGGSKKPSPKKDSGITGLSKIKLRNPIPKDDSGNKLPLVVSVFGKGGFSGSSKVDYRMSEIEENPVLMIKKEPKLAKQTTATPEQVKIILNTSTDKLKQL